MLHEQLYQVYNRKFDPILSPFEEEEEEGEEGEEGEEEREEVVVEEEDIDDDDDDDGLTWVIEEDRMYLADKRLLVCIFWIRKNSDLLGRRGSYLRPIPDWIAHH